ncbi:hypothetical protein WJX77_012497 [Trebouxia sp. C0004]
MYQLTHQHRQLNGTLQTSISWHQKSKEEWHACAPKRLQMAGTPWQGHWTFLRADCNPDLYWWMHPDYGVASLTRESTSGQVYYGEMCHNGTWEPVCIKKKPTGALNSETAVSQGARSTGSSETSYAGSASSSLS